MLNNLFAQTITKPSPTVTYTSLVWDLYSVKRPQEPTRFVSGCLNKDFPQVQKQQKLDIVRDSLIANVQPAINGFPYIAGFEWFPGESLFDFSGPINGIASRRDGLTQVMGHRLGSRWAGCLPGKVFASRGGYRVPKDGVAPCGHRVCPWCHARRVAKWCRRHALVGTPRAAQSDFARGSRDGRGVFLFTLSRRVTTVGLGVLTRSVREKVKSYMRSVSDRPVLWRLWAEPVAEKPTWSTLRVALLGTRGKPARNRERSPAETVGRIDTALFGARDQDKLTGSVNFRPHRGYLAVAHVRRHEPAAYDWLPAAEVVSPPVTRPGGGDSREYHRAGLLYLAAAFWRFPLAALDPGLAPWAWRMSSALRGEVLAGQTAPPHYKGGRKAAREEADGQDDGDAGGG